MGAFAISGSAGGLPSGPTAPGSYPLGTVLTGICNTGGPGGEKGDQITTRFQIFENGTWEPPAASENSAGDSLEGPPCTFKVEDPGLWRIYVTDYHRGGSRTITYYGPYQIGGPSNPCKNGETEVIQVTTPNGGSTDLSKLVGKHFAANQLITFDNDVEIELGDRSIIRATKGSKLKLEGCNESQGEPTKPLVKFGLILGKVWAQVCSALNEKCMNVHISTERVVAGNRGTTFWINYAHGTTTLHVDQGSMTLSPIKGKGKWKTVIVTAGHTATQRGTKAPVVRRAPISLNPPF
jgi:hypothetical protein